jgi:hypothetical protein
MSWSGLDPARSWSFIDRSGRYALVSTPSVHSWTARFGVPVAFAVGFTEFTPFYLTIPG